jgi:phosphoribosylformimino-5-aminoimidazole carboxamide ribotide isomerase
MLIYPAIDLRGGQVVRLHQGDYAQETRYRADPLELAQAYAAAGAQWLHVVDLDGARSGSAAHRSLIARIVSETSLHVQSGGGVRTRADFDSLLDAGVRRVVVGSTYVRDPEEVARWIAQAGAEKVCLALDVREQGEGSGQWQVQVAGWRESSSLDLYQAIENALAQGAKHFLVTDIGRDGTLAGPNVVLYRELVSRFAHGQFQASGGVAELADLQRLHDNHAHGVVIGKALLEGRFSLEQALQCGVRSC